jgi:hypothetical protein
MAYALDGFTGYGKTRFSEGYGLQAVHNCCVMNSALAAEGCFLLKTGIVPQPLQPCRTDWVGDGFSQMGKRLSTKGTASAVP